MSLDAKKKKEITRRELIIGSAISLVSLPLVFLALYLTVLSVTFAVTILDNPPPTYLYQLGTLPLTNVQMGVYLLGMSTILGLTTLYLVWRVFKRGRFLVQRRRGLRHEKQRAATLVERDTARLEVQDAPETSFLMDTQEKHARQ
jgi:hypothetical protein